MENMPSPNIQFYYMREGRQTPATAARPSQPQEADQRGQTWFGRWGSAHPAPVALPQLSTLQRGPAASCVVQSHSALRSRHQPASVGYPSAISVHPSLQIRYFSLTAMSQ